MKRPYEINHRLPLVLGVLLCGVIGWITGRLIQTQQTFGNYVTRGQSANRFIFDAGQS